MATIEIAVQDAAGATIAKERGANRIELCSALTTGGLTPSLALTEAAVAVGIDVAVLVRPRPGDFEYSPDEIELCARDIELAIQAGASGVVIGALRDGGLDTEAIAHWRDVARAQRVDAEITVHRCVDVLLDQGMSPNALLAELNELGGITRILTSGGAPTCREGREVLGELARNSGAIEIQAGGGLKPADIPDLIERGLSAFHLSARAEKVSGPTGPGGGSSSYDVTDADVVAQAVACTSPESESR